MHSLTTIVHEIVRKCLKEYFVTKSIMPRLGGYMSSENIPSEKLAELGNSIVTKRSWTVHLKTIDLIYFMALDEAKREERSLSYIISKIVEKYYEEKSKPRVF